MSGVSYACVMPPTMCFSPHISWGAVQLNIGAETISAVPGQVYFINKGTPHGFNDATQSTATAVEVFVK
jgi:quercetin dioxygenase-like cupin family protein